MLVLTFAGILVVKLGGAQIDVAPEASFNSQIGMVENLGMTLFNKFLVPFELVSVLFLSAMVGGVMLGRKEKGERNF